MQKIGLLSSWVGMILATLVFAGCGNSGEREHVRASTPLSTTVSIEPSPSPHITSDPPSTTDAVDQGQICPLVTMSELEKIFQKTIESVKTTVYQGCEWTIDGDKKLILHMYDSNTLIDQKDTSTDGEYVEIAGHRGFASGEFNTVEVARDRDSHKKGTVVGYYYGFPNRSEALEVTTEILGMVISRISHD